MKVKFFKKALNGKCKTKQKTKSLHFCLTINFDPLIFIFSQTILKLTINSMLGFFFDTVINSQKKNKINYQAQFPINEI